MTRFFVPGAPSDVQAERAYGDLRAYAEARAGRPTRATRIQALICRREGGDSETRVGERDPCGGGTVHAIFATTEGYTVIWEGGYANLSRRQIYAAIPFD
jgi:hypothetical protein